MKIGDYIICKDNINREDDITIGGCYKLVRFKQSIVDVQLIILINDNGKEDFFNKERFVSLCELRKNKLERLKVI